MTKKQLKDAIEFIRGYLDSVNQIKYDDDWVRALGFGMLMDNYPNKIKDPEIFKTAFLTSINAAIGKAKDVKIIYYLADYYLSEYDYINKLDKSLSGNEKVAPRIESKINEILKKLKPNMNKNAKEAETKVKKFEDEINQRIAEMEAQIREIDNSTQARIRQIKTSINTKIQKISDEVHAQIQDIQKAAMDKTRKLKVAMKKDIKNIESKNIKKKVAIENQIIENQNQLKKAQEEFSKLKKW